MKRTIWTVVSVTAAVMIVASSAASASSSSGYQSSITAILGSDGNPASAPTQERDYSSVAAIAGTPSPAPSNDRGERDYASISALVGGKDQQERATTPAEAPGYRSVSSVVGPVEPGRQQETRVAGDSGFDWGDALVGAIAALGFVVISLATMRTLRRRRVFAESRA